MAEVDLTELNGVGPSTAQKLKDAGYTTYESIAVASVRELAASADIPESIAAKIIASAREKLEITFMTAEELLQKRSQIVRISTGSKNLDNLLGGGVETGSVTEFYGEYGTGKTQIAHQLCVTVQLPLERGGVNGKALYIDSEGTFRPERIMQIAKSFDLDPMRTLRNIVYARAYNSDHQMLLTGQVKDLLQKEDIKLVVIDSVTGHFRSEYPGRESLAMRQQKLNRHMHELNRIAGAYNIAIYVTNQVMARPDVFWGDATAPVGGHILSHASTHRVYLRKSKGNLRIAKVTDSPCLPEAETVFSITEQGIRDPER